MGLYTSVRGWVNYHEERQEDAIRAAIASAVERAQDSESAAYVASYWQFIKSGAGSFGGEFAFWGGVVKNTDRFIVKAQIESIAAALPPDLDTFPDGRHGYGLQGLFDVRIDEGPRLEWRLYGGALHENSREIPLWGEQRL